jgi:hypothetical protein
MNEKPLEAYTHRTIQQSERGYNDETRVFEQAPPRASPLLRYFTIA